MSKAAELAALIGSQTALSNRNLVINGAMQVAQRGTSSTGIANNSFLVDRFKIDLGDAEDQLSLNCEQSTDAPAGFTTSLKYTVGTAETTLDSDEFARVMTLLEAQNFQHLEFGTSGAKSLTLTFYVKSSVTGDYNMTFYQDDATGQIYSQSYTINAANTWEKKTITISGNTVSAIANDNGIGFYLWWGLSAGSNFKGGGFQQWGSWAANRILHGQTADVITTANATWQLTGVQLEVGEQATPFEHRSYGDELARCQRYYESNQEDNAVFWSGDTTNATTNYYVAYHYLVEKRAAPTITLSGTAASSGFTSQDAGVNNAYTKSCLIFNDADSTFTGAYFRRKIAIDAEL